MNHLWRISILLLLFLNFSYCNDPKYYDSDTYDDCFQGAHGWYHVSATCIFPLTQFERNHSTAIQMCGAVNHSIGYRETNWLIATQLLEIANKTENFGGATKIFWTGLQIKSPETIGVEAEDATEDFARVSNFTSIYNPLWAIGEPPETLPNQILTSSCIALDLQDASKFGWRVLPCSTQLPILCQNYACLRGTFRCADNSKCVPASVVNDGFDDCLDGSDERTSPDASSNYLVNSATTSLSQKTHEWPLTVSSGGVLSPSTLQYGRGECTHRWTVMSPENREFAIWIEWLSPFTSTTIMIEGKDESARVFVNSRNATSAITLTSSSFVLTALDTDTRKADFQVFYQQIDPTLCKISSDNRLSFSSEFQPSACHYQFSTNSRTSYVALLIDTCQGLTSTIAVLQFNVNSTVSLSPTPTKRLLILPTSDVSVHVSGSTWPGAETRLEIQFFELKLDGEKTLDVFLIDRQLEIEWHAKFGSGSMDGDYRTLTVNMIQTDLLDESTWKIEQFRKTCNEDSVQILSANTSQFLPIGSGLFSAIGPTTVLIRQSAEPFEFRAAFNRQPESSVSLVLKQELISVITSDTVATGKKNTTICPLPPIVNGYIASVSNFSYRPYTRVITQCAPGFVPLSPIFCSQPGEWLNEGKLSLAALPLTCQVAVCQNQTIVETSLNMVPDTYDISYGTVRRYPKWELANFAPFCVCGDDNNGPNLWSCYNYLETFLENMSGACIIPQVQDAEFMRQDATTFDVFPTGYLIRMDCFLCPNLQKWYKCLNGLWYHNNTLQPYDSFQCNCAEDPEFADPCAPHGTYRQLSGEYMCQCDSGYKFHSGTCVDIDECVEGSDYCDQFATCHNFDGGFNCICPQDFHIYQPDNDLPHWDTIQDRLIAGYSCVESTCNGTVNLINYGVTVIEPPDMQTSIWYRSGTITPFYYATNLCNEGSQFPCVYPFFFSCIETTMFQNRDPLAACPVLDSDIYDFRILGPPYFHVFQILDVKCKNSSLTMIGRPAVFCNANLTWEALPECIEESCADPTGLVVWPLSFYTNRPKGVFTANTILFFRCELGYQLLGVENMQCTKYSDSDEIFWNNQLPTCYSEPLLTTTTTSTTTTTNLPDVIYDDIVIADSVLYEETNVLEQRSNWIMSGDWTWTSSQCILHQWTFPTSFMVTSSPILLSSTEEIELSVDVRQSQCDLQVSVFSSADRHIPAISEFKRVMNSTKKCGSLVVKLKNLKGQHLAISITANGFVEICAVTIRQKACKNVEFDGLKLPSSAAFSMRRYLPASCSGSISQIVTVNGYCDSQRGWVIQREPCMCSPTPSCTTQRDSIQTGQCTLNSCSNGKCLQFFNGTYDCTCNYLYVREVTPDGTPYCKPNHCLRTSQLRNSGYNCDTGNADYSLKCPIQNQFGSFCQFQGTLFNNSYTYVLGNGMEIAIATNVCENSETKYALSNSYCKPLMSPPTIYDGCDICAGSITHCVQSDPPFVGGAWCDCANDNEFGRSCAVSKFCFNNTDHTYRCLNGGTCNMDVGICECPIEFQGEYCQNYVGSDNCEPGEKYCVNGRCRRENEAIYCNCDDGWIKDSVGNCTIAWDFCALNNPCQQSGQCSFNLTTGQQNCDCSLSGWKGQYCEVQPKFDDCSVCQYSQKCFDTFTGNVRCQCAVGYGGQHCAESISDCDFQPCLNNGTCNQFNYQDSLTKSVIESYNCTCPTGYSGSNCQWIINPPARNCSDFIKCENGGTCGFDKNDNAICHCTDQYFGTHCERLCSEQCAHSYGCINNGSFFCECYEGFSSKYCDVVDNLCEANVLLCQNHGTCNSTSQSCDCTESFSGKYCEINGDLCMTNSITCENGGTCVPTTGKCECPPNFTGDQCENQIHTCSDITCYNGGTCIAQNATCTCLPGTTGDRCQNLGQPCKLLLPNGTYTDYCLNGGKCTDLPNGAACDCDGTEYSGRRCETKATFNFNLVFNGLPYDPDIVSIGFSNATIREFTLCSFVQYNNPATSGTPSTTTTTTTLPPYLSMRGYGSSSQQIIFDNNGFFICDPGRECSRAESSFSRVPITANTWHHFCIVSPDSETSPKYLVYLDGVKVNEQFAERFNPGENAYIYLAPSNVTFDRFVGMISMTQLYLIRLNEQQIGQLAFDCYNTISNSTSPLAHQTLIKWNGSFTRVSSYNPGVFVDPAGICKSVKCMFGRQVNTNNYNSTGTCDKDRIAPTVLRCPSTIRELTVLDFVKVEWKDEDISFFDNIGVVRIDVNYHNGQQFGVGITAVRYIAFDAAGNSAECTFDVIVAQKSCPSPNQISVENGTVTNIRPHAPYANLVSYVTCDDHLFPFNDRPKFYTCNIMGDFQYGGWSRSMYYLPACGKTIPALQSVNGTVVESGNCQQVYQKLRDTIWQTANCDQISSCSLTILPPCDAPSSILGVRREQVEQQALQYTFSTKNSTSNVQDELLTSLQEEFTVVRQDGVVECDSQHPIMDSNGNFTICVSCPAGTYANITANKCEECPVNTYSDLATPTELECTMCPEGFTTGTETGAIDKSQCYKNCKIGEYEQNGNCLDCPIGTFGAQEGLQKCTSCGFDLSTSSAGATSDTDCTETCPPGQQMVRSVNDPRPVCLHCAMGYYKAGTRGACLQCPRGLTTVATGSMSINDCNQLNCIDQNTMRNQNATIGPNTPYSELCIACEQGQFQNAPNSDHCVPCSALNASVEVPVTCQSTCSPEIDTAGCNCQITASKYANCAQFVEPVHNSMNALKIVLPLVGGVLLVIVAVVAFCFRKQIIAWFRKSHINDNQHVAPSRWDRPSGNTTPRIGSRRRNVAVAPVAAPPTSIIPRPNLRIVTSREELDQLPPLPSSSTPSFHVDSVFRGGNGRTSSGMRHLGSDSTSAAVGNEVFFEANGAPVIVRSARQASSDDSSLDSFF